MRIKTIIKMWKSYIFREKELKYFPFRLWVEPTSVCNLRCVMCPQSLDIPKKHGYMKMELFKKIIDEAKEFVHDINVHHTGEATLHPQLAEMIRYAENNGILTKLHTNATLLKGALSKKLIEAGLSLLSFSFDGFEAEVYESIRIKAKFNKTLNNVIEFLKIKKEKNSAKPYTILEIIHLNDALSKHNKKYKEFIKKFDGLPLDEVIIKEPHNWAGRYDLPLREDRYSACTFPWYALVINWNGVVTPCPQDYYCEIILGDVNKQTLKEIWNSEAIKDLRRRMKERDIDESKPCYKCDMLRRGKILGVPSSYIKGFIKELMKKDE